MRRYHWFLIVLVAGIAAGCSKPANVEQERAALMAADRDWSQTAGDPDKFVTFLAADGSIYPPGMPIVTGPDAIKEAFRKMSSAPGFALSWTPNKAEVSAEGDIGYTTGAYEVSSAAGAEKGKYVTVWKKQADRSWKVAEDIFNADGAPPAKASEHVLLPPAGVTWGDTPPGLPRGAKVAVMSGDPSKPGPYTVRLQLPAGYKVAPHWHPTDENVTVVSGTLALGMGDTFDQPSMKQLPAGGYAVLPAQMHHFAMAKTAATIQIHGTGPFAINYVNPADDPRQQAK